MKKLKYLTIIGALLTSLNGYSQGDVIFGNDGASLVINGQTGAAAKPNILLVGLYYSSDLSAIPDLGVADDSYTMVGTSTTVGATLSGGDGRYGNRTRTIPVLSDPTKEAMVQVRAWSATFTTYELAFASTTAGVLVGASNFFIIKPSAVGSPGTTLVSAGLQGFTVAPVPEPSMIALSLLGGLGAMVLLRRRK